jgi:hypothetical protein
MYVDHNSWTAVMIEASINLESNRNPIKYEEHIFYQIFLKSENILFCNHNVHWLANIGCRYS